MTKSMEEIQQLAKEGNLEQAEAELRRFLIESPDDIEGKILLGKFLGRQSKFEEALEIFEDAHAQDPSQNEITFYLGLTYESLKNSDKAIEMYQSIEQSTEYGAVACYRLGKIFADSKRKRRDAQKARRYFILATKHENPLEEAFLELATIEKEKRAIYILKNGLEKFPDSARIYERLSSYYLNFFDDNDSCLLIAHQALENGIETNQIIFYMANAYFNLGEYDKAYEMISKIKDSDDDRLSLLSAIFLMEKGDLDTAAEILTSLISADFANNLNFTAHLIAICCFLRKGDFQKAENILEEIPYDHEFYDYHIYTLYRPFNLEKYFDEAFDGIISQSKNEISIAKAHGIRLLSEHMIIEENALNWREIKKELEIVLHSFPDSSAYHKLMGNALENLNKPFEAVQHYITAQLNTDEQLWIELHPLLTKLKSDDDLLNALFEWFETELDRNQYLGRNRIAGKLLDQIISFFFTDGKYDWVIKMCGLFTYDHLVESDVLFELAFSYNEVGKKKKSIVYYEATIKEKGPSSAVLNNLSLIYEGEGDLSKAKSMLEQAINLDGENEKAQKNFKRVQQKIQEEGKLKRAYEHAVKLYLQENETIRRAIAQLYKSRIEDDLILCSLTELATLLKVSSSTAGKRIGEFFEKQYFEEAPDTGLIFEGYILKLNPGLKTEVEKELEKAAKEEYVERLVVELSPENLEQKYGYDQSLIDSLTILTSPELIHMLERDLREAVIALATQSYKSALILCGSIVEAVLMDRLLYREESSIETFERIQKNEGKTVKAYEKNIKTWSLGTILDVAREENLISMNLYHWGHGIRGFRNLVHPAVESRQEMEVSRENAEVAWSIVKRLLKEIS